ncbi:protein LphB [Legionella sp.]|uniref:protein LphB n=1 Tax=Legionella sp. TaxID=459 RepID=UPI003C9B99AC
MNSLSSRKELLLAFFLAAYCAYYLAISLFAAWGFTTDDAYISWTYAAQLAQGQGLHWQASMPRVEGYSNFLWVLLAALIIKLQWPLALTIKWISVFSLGMGLLFLYRLSRLFFSPLLAMLPVFLFSHYAGVIWWTVSGLESTFFCALSLLLIWQCAAAFGYTSQLEQPIIPSKVSTYSWINTNIILLLLSLTRFEGCVWVIPVTFFVFCHLRNNGVKGFTDGYKTLYLWGIISFFCFVFPYTVYFIWRIHYFGHLIPNSYLCKALAPGQVGIVDLDYLQVALSLIVASLPYFLASKDCRHLLLWLPSLLYGLMLWSADPLLAYLLRLFLAPLALFSLLAVLGVYQFLQYFKLTNWNLKLITVFVIINLTFLFIPGTNLSDLQTKAAEYQGRNQNRMMIAKILNEQAAPGATVLLDDCGIIRFNARPDIRFIDSQCLNNEELMQASYGGNLATYAVYLKEQIKPQWVIVNKPSVEMHLNFLVEALREKHFLSDYQRVAVLRSRALSTHSIASNDYYLIYRRREVP